MQVGLSTPHPKRQRIDSVEEFAAVESVSTSSGAFVGSESLEQSLRSHGCREKEISIVETIKQVLKQELEQELVQNIKAEIELLKSRLDSVSNALEPAVIYATLESAIYEFVQIDDIEYKEFEGDLKYGVASACSVILTAFAENDHALLGKKNWRGPGVSKVPSGIGVREKAMIQGLYGLAAFIDITERDNLVKWESKSRNTVSHDGKLLCSLFQTPEKGFHGKFEERKQKVKNAREHFTLGAKASTDEKDIRTIVEGLVEKYEERIGAVNSVSDTVIQSVLVFLNRKEFK